MKPLSATVILAAAALCASAPATVAAGKPGDVITIDPAAGGPAWRRHDFSGSTEFVSQEMAGKTVLRVLAKADDAALLWREIEIDLDRTPLAAWRWRVDRLQPSAEMAALGRDDYAASIFFLFEKPGLFNRSPRGLVYVWGRTQARPGDVLTSDRNDRLRAIVLADQDDPLGVWREERRALLDDYTRAFGEAPPGPVIAVGFFTDADQTGERALAFYDALTVSYR